METALNKIRVNRYPAYKDSGVEWLGEIPEHWELIRMKFLFVEINERSTDGNEELLSVSQYSGVTKKCDNLTEGELLTNASTLEGYKKVSAGDLVVNIMLAWNGSLGFSPHDGLTSPAYSVYRLQNNCDNRFFHYLLRSETYKAEYKRNSTGVVESRLRLYTNDFFTILSILPSKHQQKVIGDFLDKKTEQIDKAIAQKERVIELLKEKRQILIQRAVTRGLDPNVKMKESGVEWIGEIPEHWKIKALKYIAFLQSGMTISSDSFTEDGFPVYGGNGFRGYTSTYTNEGEFALIGRQGALCGNVNYAKGKFFASEHAIVVYPKDNENYFWLGETIRIADFNRLSQSAAQPGIAVNVVKNVLFPYPPAYEQSFIAQYLGKVYHKIDQVISFKETEIEKLKEFKGTLINSVVTGKIKV
jgi:type I restriction enzyme S subunit